MGLHKIRPRLKNYSKTKLYLKSSKNKNIKFFSPDITYLNPK